MADENLKRFIKDLEGYSSEIYDDTAGNPTVGYGANLNSPEVSNILQQEQIDPSRSVSADDAETLMDRQLEEKVRYFNTIKQSDFPNAQLTPNKERALLSAGYNSPKIWGPNLRQQLDSNDDGAVMRELMLKSNKNKEPGIQKRRLAEALEYAESLEQLKEVYESLPLSEQIEISSPILGIKNPNERKKVLDTFPFLKPQTRFRKLRRRGRD